MTLLVFVPLGILLGLLYRTPPPRRVAWPRYLPLLLLTLAASALAPILGGRQESMRAALLSIQFGAGVLFSLLNYRNHPAFALIALGTACNFAVIAVNGFAMPVTARVAEDPAYAGAVRALKENAVFLYRLADDHTRLLFLGDVLFVPRLSRLGFFSIGDVILGLGAMLYAAHLTCLGKAQLGLGPHRPALKHLADDPTGRHPPF